MRPSEKGRRGGTVEEEKIAWMRKLIALREERPVLADEIVWYEEYLSPRDTAYGCFTVERARLKRMDVSD